VTDTSLRPTSVRQRVSHRRGVAGRNRLPLVALAVLISVFVTHSGLRHVSDERGIEPLRAVEAASTETGRAIGIISPEVREAWQTGQVPSEADVEAVSGPGNDYLEPLFYATTGSSLPGVAPGRCHFLAVQDGVSFAANRVSSLLRVCFTGSGRAPISLSGAPASTTSG
jgi:hypothetical protein